MKIPKLTTDRDINLSDPKEVIYWTKRLGVTKRTLRDLIKIVGTSPSAVQERLKLERTNAEIEDPVEKERRSQRLMEITREAMEQFARSQRERGDG